MMKIEEIYEVIHCSQWINQNNFQNTCLQFPDYLLRYSSEITRRIQARCNGNIFVLADTCYESCCIDYIAAQHVNADSIIHFGPVCISKPYSPIPFLRIYEKVDFDLTAFLNSFRDVNFNQSLSILFVYDLNYHHVIESIRSSLIEENVRFQINSILDIDDIRSIFSHYDSVCYLGSNDRKLFIFKNSFNFENKEFYLVDDKKNFKFLKNVNIKTTKRSNFLVDKIRKANTIGILLSTISVRNYLKITDRIKQLCKLHNKQYYVITIGKINAAKLANFLEIDVFVLVSCPLNSVYDSTEFYKPVASVYELEIALNWIDVEHNLIIDFDEILLRKITAQRSLYDVDSDDVSNKLLSIKNNEIGLSLKSRTWTGLQLNYGNMAASVCEEGQIGLASSYMNEPKP